MSLSKKESEEKAISLEYGNYKVVADVLHENATDNKKGTVLVLTHKRAKQLNTDAEGKEKKSPIVELVK